jgi:hypothetical protein
VLIVEQGLSASLAQRVLDFPGPADRGSGGGFTLHLWTPAVPAVNDCAGGDADS